MERIVTFAAGMVATIAGAAALVRWGRGPLIAWMRARVCPEDPVAAAFRERRLAREDTMTDVCVLRRPRAAPLIEEIPGGGKRTDTHEEVATVRCQLRKPAGPDAGAIVALPLGTLVAPGWLVTVRGRARNVYSVTAPGPDDVEILAEVATFAREWIYE